MMNIYQILDASRLPREQTSKIRSLLHGKKILAHSGTGDDDFYSGNLKFITKEGKELIFYHFIGEKDDALFQLTRVDILSEVSKLDWFDLFVSLKNHIQRNMETKVLTHPNLLKLYFFLKKRV